MVPWLLYRSRKRIRDIHYERLIAQENAFDAAFQQDESPSDDDGYLEALQELAIQAMHDLDDSLGVRDSLLRPLLQLAVRGGAACLSLAQAHKLDEEREASWGDAGAWWADTWAPDAAMHAAFHPRFRAGVCAMLLASHRGLPGDLPGLTRWGAVCTQNNQPQPAHCLPALLRAHLLCPSASSLPAGTGPDRGPIHLPPTALLEVVRAMAGRDMEAAWVPLARVPSHIDLNTSSSA